MPMGMSVDLAIYDAAHGYPGGIQALAKRMKLSANTLTHKVNPQNTTHHLKREELELLMYCTGNTSPLQAMAARLGYTLSRAAPDQAGGDPNVAVMNAHVQYAEFTRACVEPLRRTMAVANQEVTGNEMRRAEYHAQEMHAAVDHAVATLRGYVRKAPPTTGAQ